VELEDTKMLFDVWEKTAMAMRKGAAGVHKTEADVGKDGNTLLRVIGKSGALINTIKLNKLAPDTTKILDDYDKRVETVHSQVMSEANTSARIQSAIEGGMLTLATGVQTSDPKKKLEAMHEIAAGLEAEYLARVKQEKEWLEKSLTTIGLDEESVVRLSGLKIGATKTAIEAELVPAETYQEIFNQTFEEDLKSRPGLTPGAYANMLREGIMTDPNMQGQHKLNALNAVKMFEAAYEGAGVEAAVEPVAPPTAPYQPTVEGMDLWQKVGPTGGPTGNVKVPEIYHKKLKEFGEGKYKPRSAESLSTRELKMPKTYDTRLKKFADTGEW
jgi:hypothetical protein